MKETCNMSPEAFYVNPLETSSRVGEGDGNLWAIFQTFGSGN